LDKSLGTGSIDRSARVHTIKRVIIGLIVTVILLPSFLCIVLFGRINKMEKQIQELSSQKERVNVITESTTLYEPNKAVKDETADDNEPVKIESINIDDVDIENSDSESENAVDESADAPYEVNGSVKNSDSEEIVDSEDATVVDINNLSEADDENDSSKDDGKEQNGTEKLKRVYLTFDDGPSSNTSKILDILDEYGVKGTFFVVGRLSDTTTPMYKRIVNEGHAIGMHSYTHKYSEIYNSVDSFVYDVERIQSLIYEQTGVLTKLYRFPGGSTNTVSKTDISLLKDELNKRDIKYFDWNVLSGDASSTYGLPKETLVRNCTANALGHEEAIILMHDLPEKATTVEALPEIIEYFQSIGVEILPLDENVSIECE